MRRLASQSIRGYILQESGHDMKFPQPLVRGTLLRRYRRSLVDVRLEDGSTITAHVFNVGPLPGCCERGSKVLLYDSGDVTRHHPFTWELVEVNGTWVGVNPTMSRKIVREAIIEGAVSRLQGYAIQEEAVYGKRRKSDFVLQNLKENCFIHLHPVCWVENGQAFFPEATSALPRRSMQELADIAKRGHRAVAFFHILRNDCRTLRVAPRVDGHTARAIERAQKEGVEFIAYTSDVSPEEITLGSPVRFKADR
jgi:sugar fermentation stimulation protein A